jgi:hypothetical protein
VTIDERLVALLEQCRSLNTAVREQAAAIQEHRELVDKHAAQRQIDVDATRRLLDRLRGNHPGS